MQVILTKLRHNRNERLKKTCKRKGIDEGAAGTVQRNECKGQERPQPRAWRKRRVLCFALLVSMGLYGRLRNSQYCEILRLKNTTGFPQGDEQESSGSVTIVFSGVCHSPIMGKRFQIVRLPQSATENASYLLEHTWVWRHDNELLWH